MPGKTPERRILALIARKAAVSTSDVARLLGVSRQAAHRRLRAMATRGEMIHQGGGRAARWLAADAHTLRFRFSTAGLGEDRVWELLVQKVPALAALAGEARRIAQYSFSEMLNNAIEHSGSDHVEIEISHDDLGIAFEIDDAGVGAFEHVRRAFGLRNGLEALAELSKGKVTTAPRQHTGEGIFFTSKAVQRFEMEANGIEWVVDNGVGDFAVRSTDRSLGTRVRCEVPLSPPESLSDVFAEYTREFEFSRTRTVVRLFAFGSEFVSRSHARRLLHGLERFREVVLDFDKVEWIGQGFADEVFRVWAKAHPDTQLSTENAAREVAFMIARAVES